jgi:O-antigen/teichoic acid export membrane protein
MAKTMSRDTSTVQIGNISGRLLATNTILNLLGMVLPLFVGVAAIPFAIKGLGKDAFGLLTISWVILGYFGLFDFGLARAATKFVSEMLGSSEVERIPTIIWTTVLVSFCFGILGSIILIGGTTFLTERILKIPHNLMHEAKLSFYILACAIPVILCSSSFRGVLEAAQRFDLTNLVTIPASMMSFIFPALSFPFSLSLSTVIFLMVLSQAFSAIIFYFLCYKVFPKLNVDIGISVNHLREMLYYGGWISITNIISPLLIYMDRFFIGTFNTLSSVTFYTAPYEIVTRLRIFSTSIMVAIFPEVSALSSNSDNGRLEMLFAQACKYVLIIVGAVIALIFFASPILLELWLGIEFREKSVGVIRILAVGVLINSLAIVPFNFVQGIGKPNVTAKFHLLEFPIYLLLLWILVIEFGINGAALAWTLRVSLDAFLLFWFVIKSYPAIIKNLMIGKIGQSILLLLLFFSFLSPLNLYISGNIFKIVYLILSFIAYLFIVWHLILNKDEKIIIKKLNINLLKI